MLACHIVLPAQHSSWLRMRPCMSCHSPAPSPACSSTYCRQLGHAAAFREGWQCSPWVATECCWGPAWVAPWPEILVPAHSTECRPAGHSQSPVWYHLACLPSGTSTWRTACTCDADRFTFVTAPGTSSSGSTWGTTWCLAMQQVSHCVGSLLLLISSPLGTLHLMQDRHASALLCVLHGHSMWVHRAASVLGVPWA